MLVKSYSASLETSGLGGQAITLLTTGFFDPSQNSNGLEFGLYATTAAGGPFLRLLESSLGIKEFDDNDFKLFPNPVSNELHLTLSSGTLNSYVIKDIQGRKVTGNTLNTNDAIIDTSTLNDGIYLITIQTQNGKSSTRKFVRQR